MTRSRWLVAVAAAGVAIFALSFVNLWLVHDRTLTGEGFRRVDYSLSAWRGVGMPVLTLGALAALLSAAWAVAMLRRPAVPGLPLLGASVAALGLVLSGAVPVSQRGHASHVDVSVGLLVPVAAALAAVMVAGAVVLNRPSRRALGAAALLGLVIGAAGAGGRWLGLQWAEGDNRFWEEGSYTLPDGGGGAPTTLTIEGETYRLGERFAGAWDWAGWTVVLHDDPRCPDARGTYHAHGEEDGALRFVKVVDPCLDGERAELLEAGIWARDP